MAPIIIDSVARFGPDVAGAVVCGGSHAGVHAAHLCAKAGVAAAVLNDAGIGVRQAGIAGLAFLDAIGMPAAAASQRSAHRRWRGSGRTRRDRTCQCGGAQIGCDGCPKRG